VPRRGSLAASDMDNNLPDWCSFRWGCIFDPAGRQKANEPFRSNMAATWAAPGVNFGRAHLAPISAQFGSNMVQLCPQLGPFKMGQSQPNRKSSRRVLSLVFPTFFLASMMLRVGQCSPSCVSIGPQLGVAKGSQFAPLEVT
jgi:hypothetical protein